MSVKKSLKSLFEKIFKEEIEVYKEDKKKCELVNKKLQKDIERINILETQLSVEKTRDDNMEDSIQNISHALSSLADNIRMNNMEIEADRKDVERAFSDIQNILQTLSSLAENIRMNNAQIEADHEDIGWIKSKLKVTMKEINSLRLSQESLNDVPNRNEELERSEVAINNNAYHSVDYFGFENYFRGSREKIKEVQKQYLPYFNNRNNVLDLGCGRGEFLELLKEQQIGGRGVDFYPEFVEYCNSNGLSVEAGDAIEYLRKQDKVDGIFAGQLIEHLSIGQIIEICELSYEKLEEGSYIILETPNPTSLAIYTNAFYVDPSHQKPVHPLTMQYLLRSAGFNKIEINYTDSSRVPIQIPELKGKEIENLEAFNQSMQKVSALLFGSQDYAIIAQR